MHNRVVLFHSIPLITGWHYKKAKFSSHKRETGIMAQYLQSSTYKHDTEIALARNSKCFNASEIFK